MTSLSISCASIATAIIGISSLMSRLRIHSLGSRDNAHLPGV